MNYGAMWNVAILVMVCCGMRLKCKMCGVDCGVLACGMLHNARCGKLRRDVKCGGEECGIFNVLCDCCVMSDVENDAMCFAMSDVVA